MSGRLPALLVVVLSVILMAGGAVFLFLPGPGLLLIALGALGLLAGALLRSRTSR